MQTVNHPIRDRTAMIAGMEPELDGRRYVFCTAPAVPADLAALALATFVEEEGITFVLGEDVPTGPDTQRSAPMARITLKVHSALEGVGLTASVSGALADQDISCNVIAAFHHDHIFVPAGDAPAALAILRQLQHRAQGV